MRLFDLTIGTRHSYLPADTDLAELEQRVSNAARTGGAMIQIPGSQIMSALVTPNIPVFIEPIETPEYRNEDDPDLTSPLDFDLSSTFYAWIDRPRPPSLLLEGSHVLA